MPLSKETKAALHEALNEIDPKDLEDLSWETHYVAVHGAGTSNLGGFKLGSMRGTDRDYRVGIFRTKKKKLLPPPVVTASWSGSGGAPDGDDIITALGTAIDAA